MALGAATIWEVRTSGSANNGGGFDSGVAVLGTDYSQQDAAEDSGTDLACADGDAAAPVITSASHNFVEADEGNIINITEAGTGFTLGRYLIVDTNANAATLDRACGADGALTGGDWYLGGAVDHPNTISTIVVAGNTIYIAGGTYNEVGANAFVLQISITGSNGTPIRWIGYTGSRATAYTTNRPVFDATGVTNALDCGDQKQANQFHNLVFANAGGDNVTNVRSEASFFNCRSTGATDDGWGSTNNCPVYFLNCEADLNGGDGFGNDHSSGWTLMACYSHNNTGKGASFLSTGVSTIDCIFESNTGTGIAVRYPWLLKNCIFYNNTAATSDGLFIGSTANDDMGFIINCIAQDNGRYGFNKGATTYGNQYFDYNCYEGNATAGLNNIEAGAHDTTSDPLFTDAAGGDFTLGAASPCLNTGLNINSNTGVVGTY